LTNVIDGRLSGTQNARYTYDAVGSVRTLSYPNGVYHLYEYDSLNRLTNLTWNLMARRERVRVQARASGKSHQSRRNRRCGQPCVWMASTIPCTADQRNHYGGESGRKLGLRFRLVSNRTNRSGSLGALGSQLLAYNTNDWLATDAYDSNGNTLWSTNGASTNGRISLGF